MRSLLAAMFLFPAAAGRAAPVDRSKLMAGDQIFAEGEITFVGAPKKPDVSRPTAAAGFFEYGGKKWPGGVLPVEFPRGATINQAQAFASACEAWSRAGGVRCVAHTNQSDHLKIIIDENDDHCASTVGNHGDFVGFNKNRMYLGKNCWTMGVIAHELGHALGLVHEHQRYSRAPGYDRDDFIVVNRENMIDNSSVRGNLLDKIKNSLIPGVSATPYDCDSIMHYARTAFSRNGRTTIDPRPGVRGCDNAGWRSWYCGGVDCLLSDSDKLFIAQIYGPSKTPGPAPSPSPNPGPEPVPDPGPAPGPAPRDPDPAPETPDDSSPPPPDPGSD